jgi:hypothetical protein
MGCLLWMIFYYSVYKKDVCDIGSYANQWHC